MIWPTGDRMWMDSSIWKIRLGPNRFFVSSIADVD